MRDLLQCTRRRTAGALCEVPARDVARCGRTLGGVGTRRTHGPGASQRQSARGAGSADPPHLPRRALMSRNVFRGCVAVIEEAQPPFQLARLTSTPYERRKRR